MINAYAQQGETQPRALGRAAVTHALPACALRAKSARRRLSVSLADVRAAVAEAARQNVRDQLIQHAGKRLVLLEHKSEEAWGLPAKSRACRRSRL